MLAITSCNANATPAPMTENGIANSLIVLPNNIITAINQITINSTNNHFRLLSNILNNKTSAIKVIILHAISEYAVDINRLLISSLIMTVFLSILLTMKGTAQPDNEKLCRLSK